MLIAIAGPYSASTEELRAENLKKLNNAGAEVLQKGHIPVIGVNVALPVLNAAGLPYNHATMMKISMAMVEKCDALLVLAESPGATKEKNLMLSLNKKVYYHISEIPSTFI